MFLDSLGYDSGDRFLVVNEFQAYLMQQPLHYAPGYFQRFITRFRETGVTASIDPATILAAAKELDGFLFALCGLHAGGTLLRVGQ